MSKNERVHQESHHMVSIRRSMAILCAVVLITATALATVAFSSLASRNGAINPHGMSSTAKEGGGIATTSSTGAAQAAEDELEIGLSTAGFAPAEVTHAAGTFAIFVDNQDVAGEYVLQLKAEGGVLLHEIRVQKGSTGWTVELAAGTYTLMVANHPDWVCQITVQ